MTKTAVSGAGRLAVAGLLCAVLAGCGTTGADRTAAQQTGVRMPAPADCDLDATTDEETHGPSPPCSRGGAARSTAITAP
ncbi:hypothetical protein AW27_001140 [Streptomyces sp. PCS3-D2]|uniref:hypothetical protein n=1 Tax=Streptomyces sp. PCS3-D2 TaxID=1460244 RepID=UPI0012FEF08A|nr:hypothetical protein [Streptomyces sp. PCS3-D2]WKV70242.1 hypothetical protein AW27_001140 [Streptomyces sp. PCS3-D2]